MFFVYILMFILSLLLVIYGGDLFVDSSIVIAKRTKIPTIIIGATIVSIATTLPELIVSSISAVQGYYELSVGNAAGSIICNTALIAGLSIAIVPSILKEKTSNIKYFALIVCSILLFIFGLNFNGYFNISLWEAIIFEIIFLAYMFFNINDAFVQVKGKSFLSRKKQRVIEDSLTVLPNIDTYYIGTENNEINNDGKKVQVSTKEQFPKIFVTLFFFAFGAGLIALGAYALVESAKGISSALGISESLVGLTVVAIGTSLPELVTTINSIRKKDASLGYGNIVGANILNLTLLMGTAGLLSGSNGLPIGKWTFYVSIPLVIVVSLLFVLPMLIKKKTYKWQGFSLLLLYGLYLIYLIIMTLLGFPV